MTELGALSSDSIQTQTQLLATPTLLTIEQLRQLQDLNRLNQPKDDSWSFTQGLLIGQLSVILVIGIFIKFFVFADTTSRQSPSSISKKSKQSSGVITKHDADPNSNGSTSLILEKTYYDVKTHSPESLDWFNVLIAQTINQFRIEALLSDNIYHSLDEVLANADLPDYIDKIKLTEIDIGDDFPIFSNCRIQHSDDKSGRLAAKIDVDLSDTLTLGIETKLLLNHPRPLTAVLPIQLSVSIVRFSGCLTVSLVNTNDLDSVNLAALSGSSAANNGTQEDSNKISPGTALMFSFAPDFRLEFQVKSLIGSRSKLQDIPKISSLIDTTLRNWFVERCIEPRFQLVSLPSMWPRKKNTHEPINKERSAPENAPNDE